MTNIEAHLPDLFKLVQLADKAIMEIYNSNSAVVTTKSDNTPLTQADIAAHDIICRGLAELFPDIPVLSEEGSSHENTEIVKSDKFWLVDPIDGTKEFVNRTGDFAVCIALIEGDTPTLGIISAPAHSVVYYGGPKMGSFKKVNNGQVQEIHVANEAVGVVLTSRSHPDEDTIRYIEQHYAKARTWQVGSQLKLPYIAEGLADCYPRLRSPLHLWDLAAGHAILVGAGGVVARPDGSAIDYHDQTLKSGDFIAARA